MATVAFGTETGITAHAGGGLASAYALTKQYNNVTVVATDDDSVVLPTPTVGVPIYVVNSGAKRLAVFPPSTSIDGGDTSDSIPVQPGQRVCFTPISATSYLTDNSATQFASQATSITTGVTLNAPKGVITTQAGSAGASGATPNTFTVTNSFARADSNITLTVLSQAGTGNVVARVNNRVAGAFDIVLSSCSAAALNGVIIVGFVINN